jgi:tetratricopeptide (TPR) repeat protein
MDRKECRRALAVCLLLGFGTLALYFPAFHFGFVNYDDPDYVVANSHINRGVSLAGLAWAFQAGYAGNWHPLTWWSHALDCQFYGLNAGGHHATNVLLHGINAVLLFLVLRRMTGAFWRSATVAALFAWHPLRVESVAWISERKDVLCGLWWMLALWAWARYAQYNSSKSKLFYAAANLFFALGLMSKPMVVTLPLVLLLLDWWPLRRFRAGGGAGLPVGALLLEKAPFFLLAAGASVLTLLAQSRGGALSSLQRDPLPIRILNALLCYPRYVEKWVWPSGLSVIYPLDYSVTVREVALAVVFLGAVSGAGILVRRTMPYWLTGWLWFVVMLVPVIGLVQVGGQAMADRYTYLPSIGIDILVCWAVCHLTRRWRWQRPLLAVAALAALAECLVATRSQLSCWKDTGALFQRALAVDPDNRVARVNYGGWLRDQGQLEQALLQCQQAVRVDPGYAEGYRCMAGVLFLQGVEHPAAAAKCYRQAQIQLELGLAFNPMDPDLHHLLGTSLALQQNFAAAEKQFAAAVRLAPSDLPAYYDLGQAMTAQHKTADAIALYHAILRLHPDAADALDNLAWIAATDPNPRFRNGAQAMQLAVRACQLTHTNDGLKIATLAAACAEAGRFEQALAWAGKGRQVAQANGQPDVAARLLEFQNLFQARRPFREEPSDADSVQGVSPASPP